MRSPGGDPGLRPGVDVTNYESMKAAADKAEGPVCIATEGLTVYLTSDEKRQLVMNIRRILSEKGGCWLNADVETLGYYMAVFKAVAGERAGEMMAAVTRGFSGQSDMKLDKNAFNVFSGQMKGKGESMRVDYEALMAGYKKLGFQVEKVPYYRDDFELHLYSKMSPAEIERLKENMKYVNIWKITVDPELAGQAAAAARASAPSAPAGPSLPFKVTSECAEGVFTASIQGRLDTITAPELLERFEGAGQGVRQIHLDVSRMSYVSSAGLRVFIMMYKSLEDKDQFEMTGVCPAVREILETTGFAQLLLKE